MKCNKKILSSICGLFIVLISNIVLAADIDKVEISFPNNTIVNPVKLIFDGKIYDEKYHYEYILKRVETGKASEIEKSIHKMIETYKVGNEKDILKIWSPDDKDGIREKFADKEIMEKNSAFYRNLNDTKLVATMLYDDVVLVFVTHSIAKSNIEPYIKVYPMTKYENTYVLTNRLKKDIFFASFSSLVGKHILKHYQ